MYPRIHDKFFGKSWFFKTHNYYTDFYIRVKKEKPTTSFLGKLFNKINGDDNDYFYQPVFTIYINIKCAGYTAEEIFFKISQSLKKLERKEEIENGEILPKN